MMRFETQNDKPFKEFESQNEEGDCGDGVKDMRGDGEKMDGDGRFGKK